MAIAKAFLIAAALLVGSIPGTVAAASTADLKLGIRGSPDPVPQGELITWTITVTNLGPGEATGVRLEAFYGSDTTAVSATSTQGTCRPAGGSIIYSLGTIAAGSAVTTTAVTKYWSGDGDSLGATVTSTSRDPVEDNNHVSGRVDSIPGPVDYDTPSGSFCPPTGGISTGGGGTADRWPAWLPAVGFLAAAPLAAGAVGFARG